MSFLFFILSAAQAVIHGRPTSERDVATYQIQIDLRLFNASAAEYQIYHSSCSGVVVGLAPLTYLTASHCLKNAAVENGLPTVRLTDAGLRERAGALKAAVFATPREFNRNGAEDMAVLVFEGHGDPARDVAIPVASADEATRVFICGFGYAQFENAPARARCAWRELARDLTRFADFLPEHYASEDPSLYQIFESQFRSKEDHVSSVAAWIGVNRLFEGEYARDLPMPKLGDSGGPWLAQTKDGSFRVLGVTSFLETFYRRGRRWAVFTQNVLPAEDLPYAAYAVKTTTTEARFLFARARAAGADIAGFESF